MTIYDNCYLNNVSFNIFYNSTCGDENRTSCETKCGSAVPPRHRTQAWHHTMRDTAASPAAGGAAARCTSTRPTWR